jgi:hypothetical protein
MEISNSLFPVNLKHIYFSFRGIRSIFFPVQHSGTGDRRTSYPPGLSFSVGRAPLPQAAPRINSAHTSPSASDRCTLLPPPTRHSILSLLLFSLSTLEATKFSSRFAPKVYLSKRIDIYVVVSSYPVYAMHLYNHQHGTLYNPCGADGQQGRKNNTKDGCMFL